MSDSQTPQNTDFARQYGTNWTLTNVSTMYEWVNIASFNIRCLELSIQRYRLLIRNQTILGLILSTLSGTLAVSQFGNNDNSLKYIIIQAIFTIFSFSITVTAGALKIYQIQERLEQSIKLKQDWIIFATAIASELQLPIELRRDALFMIKKHKDTYLDLMKAEVEISEDIKLRAEKDLPHAVDKPFDGATLPRIMINICNDELADMKSANQRNKDRFTRTPKNGVQFSAFSSSSAASAAVKNSLAPIPEDTSFPDSVTLTVSEATTRPPTPPA